MTPPDDEAVPKISAVAAELADHPMRIATARLFAPCPLDLLDFETTHELERLDALPGQERARAALEIGLGVNDSAYNMYAMGPAGLGKKSLIEARIAADAARGPVPGDWVYVNNFAETMRPLAIRLPAGGAGRFKARMAEVVRLLRTAIPAAFQGSDFQSRKASIEASLGARRDEIFARVQGEATARQLAILSTPNGFAIVPVRDGAPVDPAAFEAWPAPDKEATRSAIGDMQRALHVAMQEMPRLEFEARSAVRAVALEVTREATGLVIEDALAEYPDEPAVRAFIEALRADVILNANAFLEAHAEAAKGGLSDELVELPAFFRRYEVNALVDNRGLTGKPIIFEDNPTFANLFGAIENRAEFGNLVADFSLIRAGALHKANGGYLLVPALKLLQQPLAYEALKRAVKAGALRLESLAHLMFGAPAAATLQPEPIPLDVKIVLIGERDLYYALAAGDPEFDQIFKIAVDFDEIVDRRPEVIKLYARFIATEARRLGLAPLDRTGVARIIEEASRSAEANDALFIHAGEVRDLLTQAGFIAGRSGDGGIISAHHVEAAIRAGEQRLDRIRDRIHEQIRDRTVMISVSGGVVGQVNGLAVSQIGRFRFARPSRITATARPGAGQVLDIEREAELAGPLHAKGVLILQRLLASRFAQDRPLSLSASLVFEQSYGRIDGDSASAAELFALLSAIAQVPIRQSIAVTGSVNQFGEVQAIGGVNEKIEGFFDVCALEGLTGEQGVIIPYANRRHLMLAHRVRCAVADGDFHVFAIRRIEEGIEILTGREAGLRGSDGTFTANSVFALVEERLDAFAAAIRAFSAPAPAAVPGAKSPAGAIAAPPRKERGDG